MSDRYGFDFNNDGKVSFTESHMTYHIERETAKNNSLYDYTHGNTGRRTTVNGNKNNSDSSNDGNGFGYFIMLLVLIGVIYLLFSLIGLLHG